MFKLFILLAISITLFAQPKTINVGSYHFPPYAVYKDNSKNGLTAELISELNKIQSKYVFKQIQTTAQGRYSDFEKGKFDAIFFESKKWGWSKYKDLNFVKRILLDGEVFITKNLYGKNQEFFKDIKTKKIAAFEGYHYKFANFNSDSEYLKKNFNIVLTSSHLQNIRMVKENKADLAIVTYSFFKKFLNDHPSERDNYIISLAYDQRYILQFALKNTKGIAQKDFSRYLKKALRSKKIKELLRQYNLE